jgi:signal transduction histidine kinase
LLKIKEAGIIESDRLRKELVKDFHDELGNYLARIINYINLLRINTPAPFTREELYAKVEDLSRKLYTGTKDLIWSIDQQLDKADSLFIYIRDFGHSLFSDETNFRAYNTVNKGYTIKEGISRDVVLICKEALTNAYKHSGASEVVLQFSESDNCLNIVIKDNGKGLPSSLSGTGSGLKNFKERAEKVQANLKIWSEENKGTSVTLIIPSATAPVLKNGSVWGIFKRISYSN